MSPRPIAQWIGLFVISPWLWGCGVHYIDPQQAFEEPLLMEDMLPEASVPRRAPVRRPFDTTIRQRAITEAELQRQAEKDPELTRIACLEILARLNGKARYYIPDDIKNRRSLKVPNDFRAYKHWTPLPRQIPAVDKVPKFILVAKDIPFIGWYNRGRLVEDTQICIGKKWEWTKKGRYKVEEKDIDHVSSSYENAYGLPAAMPMALRIYGYVWIHAGDVVGGYCSHGCINLPLPSAESLFAWADIGTMVLVVDSLKDLDKDLEKYVKNKAAEKPAKTGVSPSSSPKKKAPRAGEAAKR